ncbi:MAG: porphobilinogen synthase [Thermogutta sp.]
MFLNDGGRVRPERPAPGQFPTVRMRRLRYHPGVRRLVQAVRPDPARWIQPLFVHDRDAEKRPIASMPGQFQLSLDHLAEEAEEAYQLGLGGVILFGIPSRKDESGCDALDESGLICRAVRKIKEATPDLLTITDLCFCEYTDHGHCGRLGQAGTQVTVDNDATLELLGRQAVLHAQAGADVIAPSGMMDGMVAAIRRALDSAGFIHVPIMSYSAKYAGPFYGPFRDAAESAPQFGDRRSYQMDPASSVGQALREVELDLAEGADMVMVKPALAYLDVIRQVRDRFPGVPLAAYNVSGEYSMVMAAAAAGWIDGPAVIREILTSIHRAGADIILTYWAKEAARRFC